MDIEKFQLAFEQYWSNRPRDGWHSQFEDKYDAAFAAWIDGWQKGFQQAKAQYATNDSARGDKRT
jgi:hypothetical protein